MDEWYGGGMVGRKSRSPRQVSQQNGYKVRLTANKSTQQQQLQQHEHEDQKQQQQQSRSEPNVTGKSVVQSVKVALLHARRQIGG